MILLHGYNQTMPKFLITITTLVVILWGILVYLILGTQPNNYTSIFLFLIVLFLTLSFTFSIPIYFFLRKKLPKFEYIKLLYRKGLKWGMFFSLGIMGGLFLKALNLLNLLNFGLFLLLYIGIFYQTVGKK